MKYSIGKLSVMVAALFLALTLGSNAAFATDAFRAGDAFVVTQAAAPLMRGPDTLATLSQGQRLNVLRTEGDWVGTSAMVNGRTITGWVHRRQVTTPTQYAQRRTTRRSYSYQPGPATGGYSSPRRGYSNSSTNRGFIMGQTPYGPSYWRADRKIAGY
jgi:hypothetical protein